MLFDLVSAEDYGKLTQVTAINSIDLTIRVYRLEFRTFYLGIGAEFPITITLTSKSVLQYAPTLLKPPPSQETQKQHND